jgi:heme-binding NEAT domain protein
MTPEVVSADEKENTRVVKFEVEDLFEKMNAKVSLDIAEYNYKETHDVQFAFDTNSIKLLKAGENPPTGNGKKTPIVKSKNTDTTDTGLKFNRDADANKSGNKSTDTKAKNPKTGDTTQILLFVLLLVGSLIPLAMKLRNRLAA